jgi:hypothetical protein
MRDDFMIGKTVGHYSITRQAGRGWQLRTLDTSRYRGPLPVAELRVHHDWLIPEILRREASALIEAAPGG